MQSSTRSEAASAATAARLPWSATELPVERIGTRWAFAGVGSDHVRDPAAAELRRDPGGLDELRPARGLAQHGHHLALGEAAAAELLGEEADPAVLGHDAKLRKVSSDTCARPGASPGATATRPA